jgi:hypothetical protein
VHRPKPAKPHQLGNAARVVAVSLDRYRAQGRMDVPRLQKLYRQARLLHLGIKPLRQRPGLQSNPHQRHSQRTEPPDQSLRLAHNLAFPNNLAARVNNAQARAFQ